MKSMVNINLIADVQSLPVRGAWIEISFVIDDMLHDSVAPCEGSVD